MPTTRGVRRGKLKAEQDLGEDAVGRHGAEYLVEIANLDFACRRGGGFAAAFELVALGVGLVEVGTNGRDQVVQSGVEQLLAVLGKVSVVADFFGHRGGLKKLPRSVHDLEILLVLGGGANGDFIDPFAEVAVPQGLEAIKGIKELVVTGLAGDRDEGPHGK